MDVCVCQADLEFWQPRSVLRNGQDKVRYIHITMFKYARGAFFVWCLLMCSCSFTKIKETHKQLTRTMSERSGPAMCYVNGCHGSWWISQSTKVVISLNDQWKSSQFALEPCQSRGWFMKEMSSVDRHQGNSTSPTYLTIQVLWFVLREHIDYVMQGHQYRWVWDISQEVATHWF